MHSFDLILTLTGGLAAALVFGYLTQRVGLSPIVGYLLAGVAVGPNTPGFVANTHLAEQLAEVGVILLMFGVGLQFHVEELLAVRRVAVPGAVAQSVVATLLGAMLVQAFGWSTPSGIVFGIALSVASTVVLIRVLADNNELHTRTGHIAVGWLVVEDLFTVIALVVLPLLFAREGASRGLGIALLLTGVKVAALVAFTALVGTRVIPRMLDHVAYFFVRPKKNALEVCVFLARALKAPQVRRVDHASKSKLVHFIHLQHRDQVEAPITDWLREAYQLSGILATRVAAKRVKKKQPNAKGKKR